MKYYKNFITNEEVALEDAQEYVKEKLGIKIIPKGKNGLTTLEQDEFITAFTEWYFSDNWTLEEKSN